MSDDDDKIIYFPRKGSDDEMSIDDILGQLDSEDEVDLDIEEHDDEMFESEEDVSPIVEYVNQMLRKAVLNKADSIHFECFKDKCKCRFEKGRVLSSEQVIEKAIFRPIAARLKIMFGADITERRLPQMGSFAMRLEDGKPFHKFYAFTMPTIFGENITLILANADRAPSFELSSFTKQMLHGYLERRQGLVVLSSYDFRYYCKGYYAVMDFIADPGRRVINIDKNSPKEKMEEVSDVTHVSCSPGVLSLESALQGAIRMDPNIIMVNNLDISNIPDILNAAGFTSDILFFLSLKAYDLPESISEIMSCGIDVIKIKMMNPLFVHYVAYSLNCSECSEAVEIAEANRRWLEKKGVKIRDVAVKMGKGCDNCLETGISGQLLQEEILSIDDIDFDNFKKSPHEGFKNLLKEKAQRHPCNRDILKEFLNGTLSYRDFGSLTLRTQLPLG